MKRHEQLGFNFFRYCNENLSNTNETVYVTYSWIQLPTLLDL